MHWKAVKADKKAPTNGQGGDYNEDFKENCARAGA
jgi:uncharacterized protein YihD (DUF1040 family)